MLSKSHSCKKQDVLEYAWKEYILCKMMENPNSVSQIFSEEKISSNDKLINQLVEQQNIFY